MDRSDVFHQFMQKYPSALDQVFDLGNQSYGEIRLGMRHDVVEEVFLGAYYKDGKRRLEHRMQEPELSAAVGALRVLPEAAMELAHSELKRFAG